MNCNVCNKTFSGMVCFQQHVVSDKHKKKVALLEMGHLNSGVSTGSSAALSSIHCSTCSISFADFQNYQKHANSIEHANKVKETEGIISDEGVTSSIPSESTANPVLASYSFQSPAPFAECQPCRKQFSGPEPYQQHIESAGHMRKAGILNLQKTRLEEDDGFYNPLSTSNEAMKITLAYATCDICQMQFSGKEPYQLHLCSSAHIKKADILNQQNNALSQDGDQISTKVTITASCDVCQMQFTGKEPYQLHLCSAGHMKKSGGFREENQNSLSVSPRCNVCDKDFTGPVPYQQHMVSSVHKKKLLNAEMMKNFESKTSSPLLDATTSIEIDKPNSSLVLQDSNPNWYCKHCNKFCSGPAPYSQHIVSAAHCKKVMMANVEENKKSLNSFLSQGSSLGSNESKDLSCTTDSGDSNDFKIQNDLFTGGRLELINTLPLDELNITVFYPNEEIVFDSPSKVENRKINFMDFNLDEMAGI